MLPIISCAALWLNYRRMRSALEAPPWLVALLWVATVFIVFFVIPSLFNELKKMMG